MLVLMLAVEGVGDEAEYVLYGERGTGRRARENLRPSAHVATVKSVYSSPPMIDSKMFCILPGISEILRRTSQPTTKRMSMATYRRRA